MSYGAAERSVDRHRRVRASHARRPRPARRAIRSRNLRASSRLRTQARSARRDVRPSPARRIRAVAAVAPQAIRTSFISRACAAPSMSMPFPRMRSKARYDRSCTRRPTITPAQPRCERGMGAGSRREARARGARAALAPAALCGGGGDRGRPARHRRHIRLQGLAHAGSDRSGRGQGCAGPTKVAGAGRSRIDSNSRRRTRRSSIAA